MVPNQPDLEVSMRLKVLMVSAAALAAVLPGMAMAQTPQPQQEELIVDQGRIRAFQIAVANLAGDCQ